MHNTISTPCTGNKLKIIPPEGKDSSDKVGNRAAGLRGNQRMYFIIQALKTALPSVIVQGIHTGIEFCSLY